MPSLSQRLPAIIVPLIAGLLVLTGCGSSHSSSGSGSPPSGSSTPSTAGPLCPGGATACVSQSPGARASGPKGLNANLIRSMTRTNPKLKQVKLACPQSSSYPVICPLSGIDTTGGKTTRVKGQLTVAGVDTKTHTYSYSILYAPVPGR